MLKLPWTPTNINSPLIVTDSIIFQTNGNIQDVDLVAWGQDAYFHVGVQFAEGFPDIICLDGPCNNGAPPVDGNDPINNWINDKPHVVYGYLVVDSCDILNIGPGTQVHFHASSGLWVYRGGKNSG